MQFCENILVWQPLRAEIDVVIITFGYGYCTDLGSLCYCPLLSPLKWNRLRVIESKVTKKSNWMEAKIASSWRRFEISGFWVIGVKNTVNIWGKSAKGNQLCFKLAGNSSYRGFELSVSNWINNVSIYFKDSRARLGALLPILAHALAMTLTG